MTHPSDELADRVERALAGNLAKGADKLAAQHKLFVRDRLALLLDPGSFVEDGLLANNHATDLPADGVVTGVGRVDGRPVCVMANDPTVKAGSWGARTVEKIVRLTEHALRHELPVFWLVDSAGARITDQVELFPGRRGAGRIFYNQVRLSGRVPQVCCLFGPSAAGGAYIPSFCDVVFMVEGNASMYLGSPRMAEMVIGEHATLEEMGGARMHATTSGCGDNLAVDDADALDQARAWFSYFPQSWREDPPRYEPQLPAKDLVAGVVPDEEQLAYDMHDVIDGLVDAESFFERMPLFAPELITGLGRLDGHPVGIVANNPAAKGGVLFVDSADKAARFVWLCDAYGIPLVFLHDVPGFIVGSAVEKQGIIRHGAKMLFAVSEATVPKVSIVLRKSYGAGYFVMNGTAYEADYIAIWPTAEIAVMGPDGMVNIIGRKELEKFPEGKERDQARIAMAEELRANIDPYIAAGHAAVDAVIDPAETRHTIWNALKVSATKQVDRPWRKHGVLPV